MRYKASRWVPVLVLEELGLAQELERVQVPEREEPARPVLERAARPALEQARALVPAPSEPALSGWARILEQARVLKQEGELLRE